MSKLQVHYLLTKNHLTLHYNGMAKEITKSDARFPKVLEALREMRFDDIPELVDPTAQFARAGIRVEDGLLTVRGEAMPPELNSRIMEYKSQNIPFKSLLNFWANLQLNPSFNSRQQLFKFLENKGHSITEDGCFIGYRGVTEDFKDKHSRTFDNRPNQVCSMPRDLVDDNPNNTCSHGLHIGGFEYAKSFGPKLVIVKVNPRDVVAVPNDYNGQKMRVCRFEVLSEAQAALQETVVNHRGEAISQFADDDSEFPDDTEVPQDGESLTGEALRLFVEAEKAGVVKRPMTPAQKRAHKRRYKNNHAKRGPNGKFVSKKKNRK